MKTVLLVLAYLVFAILAAGASFVSRTSLAPRLVFDYVAKLFPAEAHLSALFAILALGVIAGLVVGVSFGIPLGFLAVSRPIAKAFSIGVGAVAISMVWWLSIAKGAAGGVTATQAWSMLIEAFTLVGILCLVTGITHRLTRSIKFNVRMICGGITLLLALLLYHQIFVTFLPNVFA